MARKAESNGTLFMALEAGASWPAQVDRLKRSEANFQALVQFAGESAERFAERAIERWYKLLDSSPPPHKFVLAAGANGDPLVFAARDQMARAFFARHSAGQPQALTIWAGDSTPEQQARLLELAGIWAGSSGAGCPVRVVFGNRLESTRRMRRLLDAQPRYQAIA